MFYQSFHIGTSEHFIKESNTDFSFPAHMHECYEFITLSSGEMTVTVDGQSIKLEPGGGVLIFPNQIHSLDSEKSAHTLFIFSPQLIGEFHFRRRSKKPLSGLFYPDERLVSALCGMEEDADVLLKKGLLYLLLADFDKQAEYADRSPEGQELLARAFTFIEKHYMQDCTLKAAADALGYDYSYISRYFKRHVGLSFNDYVNTYRLNNACYLLSNTDMSVISCAMECGFGSLRTFNRNFRDRFGLPPTEYVKGRRK